MVDSFRKNVRTLCSKVSLSVINFIFYEFKIALLTLYSQFPFLFNSAHQDFRCFISAEPPPMPHWKTIPESLLQSCIKVANEAPADVKSNFRRAWANFSQEKIDSCPKPTEFKACLFTICFFHSLILGRRKFGQQGWSRKYSFNTGDLCICADVCFSYIANNEKIPWDDMRYIFGEIMYGGHITDPWDRRTNSTYLQVLLQPHIFDCAEMIPCYIPGANKDPNDTDIEEEKGDDVLFAAPDFTTMGFTDVQTYIEKMLPNEAPVLFGLHPNAEIGYLSNQADNLVRDIITLGGFSDTSDDSIGEEKEETSSGLSGGINATLTNLLSRLPENFNMIVVEDKAEPLLDIKEKGPFVIVAMQECTRMNVLISEIRRSLIELEKGLSGALNMSESMEDLVSALTIYQVPGRNPFHKCSWEKLAWWSKKGLESWFSDMLLRIIQLSEWSDELELPQCMWYPGLFNPMAFNTAVMQVTARQKGQPLDNMTTETHMTTMLDVAQVQKSPGDGALIYGVYMEGARWLTGEDAGDIHDVSSVPTQGYLAPSRLKELLPKVPVMYMKAVVVQPEWEPSSVGYMRHNPSIYDCPVYMTTFRGPTYIFLATLKSRSPTEKWTLGGVALILQSDD
jgi:dynein heavy chain